MKTKLFVNKANLLYNFKYNYDKSIYLNCSTKLIITCLEHGDFLMRPNDHISNNQQCPKCSLLNRTMSKISFVSKANKIHNKKYDYSFTDFKSVNRKITVLCKIHGEFSLIAGFHIDKRKQGCPTCSIKSRGEKLRIGKEKFIERSNFVHCNKYSYDKVYYHSNKDKVTINCSKHGDFEQTVSVHLKGGGCSKCKNESIDIQYYKLPIYLEKFKEVHNNYYDYSKFIYKGYFIKSIVICPKHGDFLTNVGSHIKGNGCPKCNRSKGELAISKWLEENNIKFEEQKRFPECKNKKSLPFDFYLPDYNLLIEYQGKQHFFNDFFKESMEHRQYLDKIKKNFCISNNIDFLEITYKNNIKQQLNKYINEYKK